MPVGIGSVVCTHRTSRPWLAKICSVGLDIQGYTKLALRPLRAERSGSIISASFEQVYETVMTFEGPICVKCKKGNIR